MLNCTWAQTPPLGGRGQTEREGWVTPPPSPPPPHPQPVAIPALRVAREAAALSLAGLLWLVWASLMDRFGVWSWEAILWELFSVVLFLWTLRQEFTSLTREFGKAGVFMLFLSMLYLLAHPPFLKIASFISHTALSVMIYRRAKT